MADIIKSGILGIVLVSTLVLSASTLNEEEKVEKNPEEVQQVEKDIHIP